ncbi:MULTISPECIES: VOC family protein [unclassified Variovorax]|uniref:VOC family protein n=1 Tax=unclassified Variovorax TaxID=663243 RepID=UPI001BD3C8AA|nr:MULTISPECIES: VOC family protein [unclassified Variovorax]
MAADRDGGPLGLPRRTEAAPGVGVAGGLGARHQFHGIQPVLPVSDVTRAARYFRDVLGFELDFIAGEPPSYARVRHVPAFDAFDADARSGGNGLVRHAIVPDGHGQGDAVYIRLWQCNARETRQWRGEIVIHVGYDVDGLHATYLKRGVEVVEPPASQPWGLREFAIREPDGHVLRFCGYL